MERLVRYVTLDELDRVIGKRKRRTRTRTRRCDHNVFHLEKLKEMTCAHEYAPTVSNRLKALDTRTAIT